MVRELCKSSHAGHTALSHEWCFYSHHPSLHGASYLKPMNSRGDVWGWITRTFEPSVNMLPLVTEIVKRQVK